MPLVATRGALSAKALGFTSARKLGFIDSLTIVTPSGSFAVNWPTGVQVGDLAFLYVHERIGTVTITGGAGGWTKDRITWDANAAVFWKALAPADMAGVTMNGVTAENADVIGAFYRGPSTATLIGSHRQTSGTTISIPGFTKSADFKGIVSFLGVRNSGSTPALPTNFTQRVSADPGTAPHYLAVEADLLRAADYTNGTAITWTNITTADNFIAFVYEMT